MTGASGGGEKEILIRDSYLETSDDVLWILGQAHWADPARHSESQNATEHEKQLMGFYEANLLYSMPIMMQMLNCTFLVQSPNVVILIVEAQSKKMIWLMIKLRQE